MKLDDIKTKYKKLDNLAKACANAQSDDFKGLWFGKLIDLAREYKMLCLLYTSPSPRDEL